MRDRWTKPGTSSAFLEASPAKSALGAGRAILESMVREDGDEQAVAGVMQEMARLGTADALQVIAEGLKNPAAASRRRAMELLGAVLEYRAAIENLFHHDPSMDVRTTAGRKLGHIRPEGEQ